MRATSLGEPWAWVQQALTFLGEGQSPSVTCPEELGHGTLGGLSRSSQECSWLQEAPVCSAPCGPHPSEP